MAMNFCLPKDRVEAFTEGLRNGEINPEKLSAMTSKERSDFLSKYVGENAAKRVNAEFESKTLLKNQEQGMVTWAKNVSGIKPAVRRDLVERIKNLDKVLDPAEKNAFLEDLASVRLGADVTQEEAQTIANMSKVVQESKGKMSKDYTFPSETDRLDYGRSVVEMENYVSDLKNATKKTRLADLRLKKGNPVGVAGKAITGTAGLAKSLAASLDNSVIGRQGLKILFTHPAVWAKNSGKTFVDMVRTWGGKEVMDEVRADIASRPNALNGLYKREKLALTNTEEAFPTSIPEKIPLFGRFFKGSEAAYTAFAYRTRADLMDQFAKLAEKTGGDIKGMGLVANSLTGRGSFGKFEGAAVDAANKFFFSPRFMKSNFDALTGQVTDYGKLGTLARKEAAKNTVKIILGLASVLGLAKAVLPDSVDLDPRSTDFGKIKAGNTRFDVSGGMAGYITLASRFLPTMHNGKLGQYSKSGNGTFTDLGEGGFGSRTTGDVLQSFFENKLAPASQIVNEVFLKHEDFNGDKPTLMGEAGKFVPIGIQNYQELASDPKSANIIVAMIADGLGIGTNTYGNVKQNSWKNSTSEELAGFKDSVGEDTFKAANKQFDDAYSGWLDKTYQDDRYKSLSDDGKQSTLDRGKTRLQKQVLKSYGYEYKPKKGDKATNDAIKSLVKGY